MIEKEILKLMESPGRSVNKTLRVLGGEQIGSGLFRDVYEFKPDSRFVIKVERDMSTGTFANATEWRNWINNREWQEFSRWLAPCLTIGQTGQILLQRRVKIKLPKFYPDKIPSLFTDKKYANFGWIGNKFVCCDYSYLVTGSYRMVKAKWWGENDSNFSTRGKPDQWENT